MNLKPQDILVLLKLVAIGKSDWSFNSLGIALGMSPSEVHAAAKRALMAKLAIKAKNKIRPNIRNLQEFLLHGIPYVFVPERSEPTRGVLTGYAAPILQAHFLPDDELPPVWPDAEGEVRGIAFSPLYKSAPAAARNDPELYDLLALVDAVRGGRARERAIAGKILKDRLDQYA